jgi:gamma-glutamyl-gamma-aminobutyrate hydrolase PuuD
VIEAVEFENAVPSMDTVPSTDTVPFMIAVQWHPEAGDDLSLFTALVAAAGDRAR